MPREGSQDVYKRQGVSYAIRLKENGNLRKLASHIDEQLAEITKDDMVSYAVYYGEFQYQAAMLST